MEPATLETPPESTFADAAAASAAADAARVEPVREYEEMLPVDMTDDERLAHGDALSLAHKTLDEIKSETTTEKARHKVEMESLGDRLDEALGVAGKLARELRDRKLAKLVPCREEKVFATGTIRVVRQDTGEVVRERAMGRDERQADLFAGGLPDPDMPSTDDRDLDANGNEVFVLDANGYDVGPWVDPDKAPESFSSLADDSEPPQPITIYGEVTGTGTEEDVSDFVIALENFGTQIIVARDGDGAEDAEVGCGDRVELVGAYGGEEGADVATFIATQIRIIDPATDIDATQMATIGEVVETKKKRGKK